MDLSLVVALWDITNYEFKESSERRPPSQYIVAGMLPINIPMVRTIIAREFWTDSEHDGRQGREDRLLEALQARQIDLCRELDTLTRSALIDLASKHLSSSGDRVDERLKGGEATLEYLKRIDVCFSCSECRSSALGYKKVLVHDCFAADLGHPSFADLCNGNPLLQMCKPIGWQSQRIAADNKSAQVMHILASAADVFFESEDLIGNDGFPTTHHERETAANCDWTFRCNWPECPQRSGLPICGLEASVRAI